MNIEISEGVISKKGKKVVIYGPEGVGKTTLASLFPDPLFIDTEGSTENYNVKRLPKPTSLAEYKELIGWVTMNPDKLKTLVIDTADWLEQILITDFCMRKGVASLGDIGYGNGFTGAAKEWREAIDLTNVILNMGIHVVFLCHTQIHTFSLPDDMGTYDRYELKLEKKHIPILKEWSDLMIFINFETNLIYQDKTDKKAKAVGGQNRSMFFTRTAAFDAKNRFGLPDKAPLSYEVIRHLFEDVSPVQPEAVVLDQSIKQTLTNFTTEEYQGIYQPLLDQMVMNDIPAEAIEECCFKKGMINDESLKLKNYPFEAQKWLSDMFPQIVQVIEAEGYGLPF